MRVLHVVEGLSPRWLGLGRAVAGLAGGMAKAGVETEIVAMSEGEETPFRPEGVRVTIVPRGPLAWWGYAGAAGPAIEAAGRRADLIHVHGLWQYPCLAASRAARRYAKPYVVSPHGMLDPWALAHKRLRKRLYAILIERRRIRGAAAIHAVSPSEAEAIDRHRFGVPVFTLPNGVDTDELESSGNSAEFLKRFPALSGKTVLLFLAQIHPRKGLAELAEAFCEIIKRRDDTALLIAGPDLVGYRAEVESLLERGGAGGRYVFSGMLDGAEKRAAFATSSIFVLPSYSEGHPVAALEAMAAGLPVILTDRCNMPEAAQAGAGIIVPPQEGPLRDAVLRLLNDSPLRERMAQKGRELVRNCFTWERISLRMVEMYRRILEGDKLAS